MSCHRSPTGSSRAIGFIDATLTRKSSTGNEGRAIALTSPLPFLTCGVFAFVAARLGLHTVSGALKLAVAAWVIGPLPLILTNAAFMKLHRFFVASYAMGWVIRLMIVAVAVGSFLR